MDDDAIVTRIVGSQSQPKLPKRQSQRPGSGPFRDDVRALQWWVGLTALDRAGPYNQTVCANMPCLRSNNSLMFLRCTNEKKAGGDP